MPSSYEEGLTVAPARTMCLERIKSVVSRTCRLRKRNDILAVCLNINTKRTGKRSI